METKTVEIVWPRTRLSRIILLGLICLIGVGGFFCLDSLAALQGHVLDDLDLTETRYMGLYSATQWGCIGAAGVGGYLIDRVFGMRWSIIIFSFLLTLSQGLFAGSAMLHHYWLMYASKVFFGISILPLSIATTSMLINWFKLRGLNMLMGLRSSIARAGSVVNMNVMGPIYSHFRSQGFDRICLGLTFFVGAAVCLVSFLCASIVGYIDYRRERAIETTAKTSTSEKKVKISDIRKFPPSLWILTMTINTYYLALFPFVGLGLVFYVKKYDVSPQAAATLNGLVYLLGAILMPVFGLVIDKVGNNLLWLLASIVLSVASHVLFAFTFINPYIPTTMLGLGYTLFTAIVWPLVAHMVDVRLIGTAFGIMNAIIGLGQAGGTYLAGYIVDTVGYFILELYFAVCQAVSLILAVILLLMDSTKGDSLEDTKQTMELELEL